MKYFQTICFFAGLLYIYGCVENEEPNQASGSDQESSEEISDSIEENASGIDNEAIGHALDGFPKMWIEADVVGDEVVIKQPCDMGNRELRIEKSGENWQITTVYGHDAEIWQLHEVVMDELEKEGGIMVVEGVFTVIGMYADSEREKKAFTWNKDDNFCQFDDFFQSGQFVDQQYMDDYTVIKEDCGDLIE